MPDKDAVDYGPLAELIGEWRGASGMDIAPEPDGTEQNPYYETILFTPVGDVTNAESQVLVGLHYRQIVSRQSNDKVFHDETGYWLWDAAARTVMHSLTIPRAVCVLAGGSHSGAAEKDGRFLLEVAARHDDPDWHIIQSPFMRDNARTIAFEHQILVGGGELNYQQTTALEIYGREFSHTDQNTLRRI